MPVIDTPHPDRELGMPRRPLHYNVAYPPAGIGENTGLLFYVHGLGFKYDDDYAQRLLPHWAERYDCVTVSVNYHGTEGFSQPQLVPHSQFFLRLREHHGVAVEAPAGADMQVVLATVLDALGQRGITSLHRSCTILQVAGEYMSFALLPALDCLQVAHALLSAHGLNRRRIFALGTSYGGTIAMLMCKFAPNTFRMVVDNSGYSGPRDDLLVVMGASGHTVGGVRFLAMAPHGFTSDMFAETYFSPSREQIRTLGWRAHYTGTSETTVFSYHCLNDIVAPTANKIEMAKNLRGVLRHDLTLVGAGDIDGRLFKTMSHGMQASLRGLFDLSYRRWQPLAESAPDVTDFDLGTVNRLMCGNETYCLSFDRAAGVRLDILPGVA